MNGLNRRWHRDNRMPERPSDEQRIAWHLEHAQVCGCRPIPKGVLKLLQAKGIEAPNNGIQSTRWSARVMPGVGGCQREDMARFVAFLRGVSPMNLKMADLKRCVESAGFTEVRTVLSSGNVAFNASQGPETVLARRIEKQLKKDLGRTFPVTVRSVAYLRRLLESDPYKKHPVRPGAKRVVTFLWNSPKVELALPIQRDGATIHEVRATEVFSSYIRTPKGPVFMKLLQSTFGVQQTTRTWETVTKCTAA